MDLGTGDGRFVLHRARREPDALIIGIDADAASMRDASRKAARAPAKGGLPNALFVVSAVESLTEDLSAVADEVRIIFPWGSLLRGVLGHDDAVLGGIAGVAKYGAAIGAFVSLTERDTGAGMTPDDVDRPPSDGFEAKGLRIVERRPATQREIAETNSSWAKRLRAGVDRPVTLLRLTKGEAR